jgi:hypothetical protein
MHFLRSGLGTVLAWSTFALALPSPSNPYAGTKVFRIPTGNQNQTDRVSDLIDTLGLPAWTSARLAFSHIDVEVAKVRLDEFHKALKGVDPKLDEQLVTMHEDLGASILKESEGMNTPHADRFGKLVRHITTSSLIN